MSHLREQRLCTSHSVARSDTDKRGEIMRKALLYKTGIATGFSILATLGVSGAQAEETSGRQIEEVIVTAER